MAVIRKRKVTSRSAGESGKLRIGDAWSAISIIALSQNNPLKAIAEFVENSIDARAKNITIVRGREHGQQYLKIIDDGEGVPQNAEGAPNFKYVATHICDSIKKRLKREGMKGIQGEFGIGLLSFWTVGENLTMSSAGTDGKVYCMAMKKDEPGYSISAKKALLVHPGTELVIHPLLAGIRHLAGEKIQNYLASELRDRIRHAGVSITIRDRVSRKELPVEPRQFAGLLLHHLPIIETEAGEIYPEIYLNSCHPENSIGLYRLGTRVIPSLSSLDSFNRPPWNSGYLQGMVDAGFLSLTPGTRDGIIRDRQYETFVNALTALEPELNLAIEKEKSAEEEKASKEILKSVQKALKEALLALPPEEYDWLDIIGEGGRGKKKNGSGKTAEATGSTSDALPVGARELDLDVQPEKKFFEYAGPLYSLVISPRSSILQTETMRNLRAICRDKHKRVVEIGCEITWSIKEGEGQISSTEGELIAFTAPAEPGMTVIRAVARQGDSVCTAEGVITITAELMKKDEKEETGPRKGLPSYTFQRATGELWRSRYDEANNIITINNGHADYLFASKKPTRKLKYICKLYAKELVLKNFIGVRGDELLERMVELSLYTEEYLK